MRFLLDECISARLSALLVDAGHDCVLAQERGVLGAPDEQAMATALAESRVLVSMDTDFGELLATSKAKLPSVGLFVGSGVPRGAGRPSSAEPRRHLR